MGVFLPWATAVEHIMINCLPFGTLICTITNDNVEFDSAPLHLPGPREIIALITDVFFAIYL